MFYSGINEALWIYYTRCDDECRTFVVDLMVDIIQVFEEAHRRPKWSVFPPSKCRLAYVSHLCYRLLTVVAFSLGLFLLVFLI